VLSGSSAALNDQESLGGRAGLGGRQSQALPSSGDPLRWNRLPAAAAILRLTEIDALAVNPEAAPAERTTETNLAVAA